MKFTDLTWVLALAAVMAACNSGPPITNAPNPNPGTGGTDGGGTGGTGGTGNAGGAVVGEGACINEDDRAAYMDLTYTNEAGETFTGPDAASEIGSDCLRGASGDPPLEGCGPEVGLVLGCAFAPGGCPQETIDALANCVRDCTQEATGLSDECVTCTGDTVACGAAFCTGACAQDPSAAGCIQCRCDNNCIQEFDECSGLPSDNECS